jgi:hypothetical protein
MREKAKHSVYSMVDVTVFSSCCVELVSRVCFFSFFRILWIRVLRKKQKTSGGNTKFDIFLLLYNRI